MEQAVTCARMKALDQETIVHMGIPSMVLMERAALTVVEELVKQPLPGGKILVVCGSGNNGGDGLAIARLLHLKGCPVHCFFAGNPDHMTAETRSQMTIARNYQVPFVNNPEYGEYTTIVDALFGIGLSRTVEGIYRDIIWQINHSGAFVAAVDMPSGISGDSGQILGIAVKAALTVTFAYGKLGHYLYPGAANCGRVVVKDIGISHLGELDAVRILRQKDVKQLMPPRCPWGNKGTFGKILVAAGSKGMSGAAYLSARAALAAGAGMVKIQTVEENREILQIQFPEAMTAAGDTQADWERSLSWCDVLLLGPGLGTGEDSRRKVQWFLEKRYERNIPLVLDADGLNLLACNPSWKQWIGENCVLTPHVGEMARLCGKDISQVKEDLLGTAAAYSRENHLVCVLKDARTVITGSTGEQYLNITGNSGMAAAGSGDVLAGFLGGLLCTGRRQKCDLAALAALGVYLHGRAGDLAAVHEGQEGLTANRLIRYLPEAMTGSEENL